MAGNEKHASAAEAKPTRAFVRLGDADQARVETLAEALGATPAAVRTMAFLEGLEALESRALGGRGNSPANSVGGHSESGQKKPLGYPRMSESEKAGLEARIDTLEARASGFSEVLSGALSLLSWTACEALDSMHEKDDGKVG